MVFARFQLNLAAVPFVGKFPFLGRQNAYQGVARARCLEGIRIKSPSDLAEYQIVSFFQSPTSKTRGTWSARSVTGTRPCAVPGLSILSVGGK